MSTTQFEKAFGQQFLDDIIEWVGDNLSPGDVFPEKAIVAWVSENEGPADVFSAAVLADWATDNGYVVEEG